ncbi:glycosyltransferase [Sulfobacillus thermotolerans]|uniref:glycosyltransferase n=1 Tax=Sulfobacillus thermotolerans TaxID=338644 RepID=UPI0033692413
MRMLIAGGGSGGHIYPALAIIDAVRARVKTLDVLYIGTDHGLEKDLVPARGIPFATIHARGLLVKGIAGKAQGALGVFAGIGKASRMDPALGHGQTVLSRHHEPRGAKSRAVGPKTGADCRILL